MKIVDDTALRDRQKVLFDLSFQVVVCGVRRIGTLPDVGVTGPGGVEPGENGRLKWKVG